MSSLETLKKQLERVQDDMPFGLSTSEYVEPASLRKDSVMHKLDDDFVWPRRIYLANKRLNIPSGSIAIYGASGLEKIVGADDSTKVLMDIFKNNFLRRMTDPYDSQTRRDLNETAIIDPVVSRALEIRTMSFLEDDFEIKYEIKTMADESGTAYTPQQTDTFMKKYQQEFGMYIQKIETWRKSKDIDLLAMMKLMNVATIVQGRALTIMYPPVGELPQDKLPDSLRLIHDLDVGEPIVDTGVTNNGQLWKLVAVTLRLGNKKILLPDEMVYITRKNWGLRRDSSYFGTSALESILIASKTYRRLINQDFPKAVVSGYLTKLIIQMLTRGNDANSNAQLNAFATSLLTKGTDIIFSNTNYTVTPVKLPVDHQMLQMVLTSLEDILISNAGATKSAMGRELNLNRDIATVQEITFKQYTRKPDEQLICNEIEKQLLNPFLSHLSGMPEDELPIKLKIVRITPLPTTETQDLAALQSVREMPSQLSNPTSGEVIPSAEQAIIQSQGNSPPSVTQATLAQDKKQEMMNPSLQPPAKKKFKGAIGQLDEMVLESDKILIKALKEYNGGAPFRK